MNENTTQEVCSLVLAVVGFLAMIEEDLSHYHDLLEVMTVEETEALDALAHCAKRAAKALEEADE